MNMLWKPEYVLNILKVISCLFVFFYQNIHYINTSFRYTVKTLQLDSSHFYNTCNKAWETSAVAEEEIFAVIKRSLHSIFKNPHSPNSVIWNSIFSLHLIRLSLDAFLPFYAHFLQHVKLEICQRVWG